MSLLSWSGAGLGCGRRDDDLGDEANATNTYFFGANVDTQLNSNNGKTEVMILSPGKGFSNATPFIHFVEIDPVQ